MENDTPDKKGRLLAGSKKVVTKVLKIRRGMKIYFSFGAGVSTGIVTFRQLYGLTGAVWISLCFAALAGAATTAFMLLLLEITRKITASLTALGLKLLEKIKAKKENEKNGDQ